MQKTVILFSLFLSFSYASFSQILQKKDMAPLYKYVTEEKWDSANKYANFILKKFKKDSSDYMSITNYAALLSAAGMVANGKMTYNSLETYLGQFIGKPLLMPSYPVTTDTLKVGTNRTALKENDAKIYGATNYKGKTSGTILSMENFEFSDVFEIGRFNNENARCSGILYNVELNRHMDKFWVMRLFVKDAMITLIKKDIPKSNLVNPLLK